MPRIALKSFWRCLDPLGSSQRYKLKLAGKLTWNLEYDERLKRIPMMTRRNVSMREANDNNDHKNMIINWISFEDEVKYLP